MSDLAVLQRRFAQALKQRDSALLDGYLVMDPGRTSGRLSIYANNHEFGLEEALAAVFPAVQRLVGEACFAALARPHVQTTPMRSGNVNDYGEHFATHIETSALHRDLPWLADIARLEWLWHSLFHAEDADPRRAAVLTAIAALDDATLAQLHLGLIPAARLYASPYPALQIWRANLGQAATEVVSLDEGGVKCIGLRTGLQLQFELLGDIEYTFLDALAQQPLLAAAELALKRDPSFNLTATLARWSCCLQHPKSWSLP